jgi:hypothetical protein
MSYLIAYFLLGSAVAVLDRKYVCFQAEDLAYTDLLETGRFQSHNIRRWIRIYKLGLYSAEILIWPYIVGLYSKKAWNSLRIEDGQKN